MTANDKLVFIDQNPLVFALFVLEFDPKLDVRVSGNDITITLLGTRYSVTYFKRKGSPGLFAKDIVQCLVVIDDERPELPLRGSAPAG